LDILNLQALRITLKLKGIPGCPLLCPMKIEYLCCMECPLYRDLKCGGRSCLDFALCFGAWVGPCGRILRKEHVLHLRKEKTQKRR